MKWSKISEDVKSIAVVGDTRQGKTGLVFKILEAFKKDKYIFQHPKPKLVEKLGFINLKGLGAVESIENATLWVDEPQLYIQLYRKRGNLILQKLLSLCGQRRVCLILSTSDTRFITRGLEAYIDVYCVKDLDWEMVKRGSKIIRIAENHVHLSLEGFRLKVNEYLFHSRRFEKFNGKYTFTKPEYFTDALSRPYANCSPPKPCKVIRRKLNKQEGQSLLASDISVSGLEKPRQTHRPVVTTK